MAELKTTTIYGDLYINNRVGIATRTPSGFLQISQSYLVVDPTGSIGIGTSIPRYPLDIQQGSAVWQEVVLNGTNNSSCYFNHGAGYQAYIDAGNNAGAATYAMHVNKGGTTFFYIRGDGYVGINASPSTTGQVYINSINTSTAHLSLASGITNSNASSTYSFKGWWGIYFNSPSFGTTGLYYIQIFS